MLRFKGKEKLEPLEIPEIVGEVHTLNASDVLLISGSKGYAIYDVDFKCIA